MKKWLVGLMSVGMLATAAWGSLTSPATLPVEYAGASGWSNATLDAMTGWDATGLGSPYTGAGGAAKMDSAGDNVIIYFDAAPGDIVYSLRRSDSNAITNTFEGKLQEAADTNSWSDVRTFNGSEFVGTLVLFTNTLSPSSRYVKFVYSTKAGGQNFGLGYVNIASGSGAATTNVKFTASSATVNEDQGAFQVTVYKTLAEGDVSGQIALSGSATEGAGADYTIDTTNFTMNGATTSATFTVTINDDADSEAAENIVLTLANVVGAGVASPSVFTLGINASDVALYAISITPPTNGTVTTTPATEAAAGATVTVNATPAGGYAVDTYNVVGADTTVIGTTSSFTMPAQAVTVTVTFKAHAGSSLIISEVADPSDNANARFVELYNAGGSSINLAAGTWYLSKQVNGGTTWDEVALTGTVAAASTYVIAFGVTNFTAAYPTAPAPNQANGNINANGDDAYFLYSGGRHTNGIVEDALGVINEDGTGKAWEYTDRRAVRQSAVVSGNPTWTVSEWTIPASGGVADMTPGVHPDGAVVFGVTFNKTTGFTVEQGTSDAVTATAANGAAPYSYSWNSTLEASYYTTNAGVFTILATAPVGGYTSTVVATDSGAQSVTNSIAFSVAAPAPKYAISIVTNAPANGTVTTTPATEAAAGATVTVNATPAGGYAVDSITVVDADLGGVTVNGTTFTMPAKAVTVTVTFAVSETPDALVDFETYSGSYGSTNYVAGGVTWAMTNAYAGNTTDDRKNGAKAARMENNRGGVGNPGKMTSSAFAQGVTKITFWYANYGVNDGGKFKVQVSSDGSSWQDVGSEYDPVTNAALTKATIDSIPAGMTYVQFITTAGSSQRVNVDDIGLFFGAPVLGVTVDRTNGFVVAEGATDAITATAANGTAPYTYSWSSTLGTSYRTTNANVFTILATAPTGSYSATVTATDATMATAQKTVTFQVKGGGSGDPAVNIAGSLSGTVGVQMNLTITLTNGAAADWYIDLTDPDSLADNSYLFGAPNFQFTPAKVGTYSLTATAVDGGDNPIAFKTVSLTVSAAGNDPEIPPVTLALNGTGNFLFTVPSGYALSRVLGADASLNDKSLVWSNLTADVHYSVSGATVTILTVPTSRQILRMGVTPSP